MGTRVPRDRRSRSAEPEVMRGATLFLRVEILDSGTQHYTSLFLARCAATFVAYPAQNLICTNSLVPVGNLKKDTHPAEGLWRISPSRSGNVPSEVRSEAPGGNEAHVVGLRGRAVLGVLAYTGARMAGCGNLGRRRRRRLERQNAPLPRGRRQAQATDGGGIQGALHAANDKAASPGCRPAASSEHRRLAAAQEHDGFFPHSCRYSGRGHEVTSFCFRVVRADADFDGAAERHKPSGEPVDGHALHAPTEDLG